MKNFSKKILALLMALMCLATIGAVSASAATRYTSNSNFRDQAIDTAVTLDILYAGASTARDAARDAVLNSVY